MTFVRNVRHLVVWYIDCVKRYSRRLILICRWPAAIKILLYVERNDFRFFFSFKRLVLSCIRILRWNSFRYTAFVVWFSASLLSLHWQVLLLYIFIFRSFVSLLTGIFFRLYLLYLTVKSLYRAIFKRILIFRVLLLLQILYIRISMCFSSFSPLRSSSWTIFVFATKGNHTTNHFPLVNWAAIFALSAYYLIDLLDLVLYAFVLCLIIFLLLFKIFNDFFNLFI